MQAQNIRHLLGEITVVAQKIASSDDVTTIEKWNQLPAEVRKWALESTLASLPLLITETNRQADDRVSRIQVVLSELKSLTTLDGDTIETPRDNLLYFPDARSSDAPVEDSSFVLD